MLEEVRSAIDVLKRFSHAFDPALIDGERAVELVRLMARAERLAGSVKAQAARRAVETSTWQRGTHAASPEQWLALVSGSSEGVAREALETAERIGSLPETATALRRGRLSLAQAAQVTAGAAVDPDAEQRLLHSAARDGMRGLRKEKERVVAAATDEAAAHRLAVRERHVRTWSRGAATHGSFSGPTEQVEVLLRAIEPLEKQRFVQARTAGEHESADAYRFDALVQLAQVRPAATTQGRSVVRARVDLAALRRGHTEPGEICEIPGVGPVAVDRARKILGDDGLLELVITDGVDVQTVVSRTRHVPDALKVAIDERDQTCKVEGCDIDHNLERHHLMEFAEHQLTTYGILGKLCPVHHDLVTHRGSTIEPNPDGTWRLRAPPEEDAA